MTVDLETSMNTVFDGLFEGILGCLGQMMECEGRKRQERKLCRAATKIWTRENGYRMGRVREWAGKTTSNAMLLLLK